MLLCRCLRAAAAAAVPLVAVGRLAFDGSKAGLQSVDKAHVERVIAEATRGSAFYESEQRKAAQRAVKNDALVARQRQFAGLSAAEQQPWHDRAAAAMAALEATRTFSRCFIHVDVDMFYAAVEEKMDPSLRERPFAVGSYAMLATSNYIARRYGVRSGMPGFIAKKLCPALYIRPPQFDLYRREAAVVRALGAHYDPGYVTVGLDELTMDVTDFLRRHPTRTADDVCTEFRRSVEAATQLTCSGGIAHTAAFAKIASNVQKPNGQHTLALRTRRAVLAYVRGMAVREVPGVGSATEQQLRALGIRTCGDLLEHRGELCYLFAEKTFTFYLSAGLGLVRTHVDRTKASHAALHTPLVPPGAAASPRPKSRARQTVAAAAAATISAVDRPPQKSTGKSVTVARGVASCNAFWCHLRRLTEGAHQVLVEQKTGTRHVCFCTTNRAFDHRSHSTTLPHVTDSFEELYAALEKVAQPYASQHRSIRLLGVSFTQLQPIPTRQRTTAATANTAVHRYPRRRRPAAPAPPPQTKTQRSRVKHAARQRSNVPSRSKQRATSKAKTGNH
ncbi:impB/mucB/samB family/impB/mucB/samB family C-terminal domain containing protein [Novymonas esmeraldas]|uniref:DNA polymerase kappa n=1 Tax=Novymonas esmeraldas TaxID=1808958 RepID=A0AAW0ET08_9TRYP